MPTQLKSKRQSGRKVSKPAMYGSKATPPQRGKRLQSKVTKVTTTASKKKPAAKAWAKNMKVPAKNVARMPPIGSRSEDLVDTDEDVSVSGDGKSKYPWNNYSKEYLHGKWKSANKTAQEVREEKKKLTGEVSELKKELAYWKKEAENRGLTKFLSKPIIL